MRILLIDNFDSFTFNLLHLLEADGRISVDVRSREDLLPEDLKAYGGLVFSPGPGLPQESDSLMRLIAAASQLRVPQLGVCLGHQAMALHAGARLCNLDKVHHGKAHIIEMEVDESALYKGLPAQCSVGRYHSWVVEGTSLPPQWVVDARDSHGEVMGMHHSSKPHFGVQWHPESILSEKGQVLLKNFADLVLSFKPSAPVFADSNPELYDFPA